MFNDCPLGGNSCYWSDRSGPEVVISAIAAWLQLQVIRTGIPLHQCCVHGAVCVLAIGCHSLPKQNIGIESVIYEDGYNENKLLTR